MANIKKKPTKKNKVGPPVKYTPEKISKIKTALENYIDDNEYPMLSKFAYENKIPRTYLYEFSELADTIKRMTDKKESELEYGMLTGKYNVTGAIFTLKQKPYLWKDKQEIDMNHSLTPETIKALFDAWTTK